MLLRNRSQGCRRLSLERSAVVVARVVGDELTGDVVELPAAGGHGGRHAERPGGDDGRRGDFSYSGQGVGCVAEKYRTR